MKGELYDGTAIEPYTEITIMLLIANTYNFIKKTMKKFIFSSLIALISLFMFSCKKDSNGMHTVKYTIQGTSMSNVTYSDANGNTQTATGVDASWTYTFTSNAHGLVLKIADVSSDGGQVGAKIFIDGNQSAAQNGVTGNVSVSSVLP